ncbi:MAG: efflux transporter outer membrane subunit [Desulfobacterales bacterium]|nr:efflux transporter outer membrane subunit [Desulfobacterales bacterium]
MNTFKKTVHMLICIGFVFFTACTVYHGSDLESPVELPLRFKASGTVELPDKWWLSFEDPILNELIDEALSENFTMKSIWDRLDQSRAMAEIDGADMYPMITTYGDASRYQTKDYGGKNYGNDYNLGVGASYEIDLWSRIRSTREASELEVFASEEDIQAAAITLTAEVAGTWYRLTSLQFQSGVIGEQISTFEMYMELIQQRFQRGLSPAIDLFQHEQALESFRSLKIQTEMEIGLLKTSLAVLLGRTPDDISFSEINQLPGLPPMPETGIPAELIQKRPDIRAAYLRLQSADKYLAAAIANQYPQITLTLDLESTYRSISNIIDDWATHSMSAGLFSPLYEGGRRKAETEYQREVVSEQLHLYSQTILDSFKEVDDALFQEYQQQNYIRSVKKQLSSIEKAAEEAKKSYRVGVIAFDRLLDILLSQQDLEIEVLSAHGDLITYRINLYRAIGGGFEYMPDYVTAQALNDLTE